MKALIVLALMFEALRTVFFTVALFFALLALLVLVGFLVRALTCPLGAK